MIRRLRISIKDFGRSLSKRVIFRRKINERPQEKENTSESYGRLLVDLRHLSQGQMGQSICKTRSITFQFYSRNYHMVVK